MDDDISQEQRDAAAPIVGRANLDAWGARPGGDLIKIAGIMGKFGEVQQRAGQSISLSHFLLN